jgi:SulP family sulfate permease
MAAAVLAGTNPMTGLYGSIAGPLAGGLVGSTAMMVVSTTSAAAVTTAQLTNAGQADPTGTLATLTAVTAVLMLVATAAGFARLIRFVSASVMGGFLFGVSLILVLGQLGDATGVQARGSTALTKAWSALSQGADFQPASVATSLGTIGIAAVLARARLAAVAPLAGILIPTLVVVATGTRVATVADQGTINLGLPGLALPNPALITPELVATAVALTIVILVQTAGVSSAHPNSDGVPNDLRRDFLAQSVANAGSALLGGIPVGGSVGQTALNVLAGARTRWASVFSGLWMLLFVVALGPALGVVPIPALAGLLILAGLASLRPQRLRQSRAAGPSSFAAAIATVLATLVMPIHFAVLTGVVLSLALVALDSASAGRVVALTRTDAGIWQRSPEVPATSVPGAVVVIDIESPGAFASVPGLFGRLPAPTEGPAAVVLRVRGQRRPTLTFALALGAYADQHSAAGGTVLVCGLAPAAIERLRDMDVGPVVLLPEADVVGGSLDRACALAERAVAATDGDAATGASS